MAPMNILSQGLAEREHEMVRVAQGVGVQKTADGGAAGMGASLVDGANKREGTVVVQQRAQLHGGCGAEV